MIIWFFVFILVGCSEFDDILAEQHRCYKNRSKVDFKILGSFKQDFEKRVFRAKDKNNKEVLLKGINLMAFWYAFAELEGLEALINKPFMPAYYECFVENDYLWIIEEFLGGDFDELYTFAQNHKNIKEDDILFIVAQISVGLYQMHKRGLMHGDFHRRNVMVSKKEPYEVRIIDFDGLKNDSKKCHEGASGSDRNYSPEMCYGLGFTEKGDIWSLASLAYYLSTRAKPFNGHDQNQNTCFVIHSGSSYLPLLGKYSPRLRNLIDWMFTQNQNYRPDLLEVIASPVLSDIVFTRIPTLYKNGSDAALKLDALLTEIRTDIDTRRAAGQLRPVTVLKIKSPPNMPTLCNETYAKVPDEYLSGSSGEKEL